ncbi:MAG TPA: MerR family DNA-binding transcriptional regulator [Chitinophagales bacterium]|nr:MerR family DNA-binding transcriptional regulator [Chitinophagales bacterium]
MKNMSKGILGIELEFLEEILRSIVRQEMAEMRDEIKQTLISKRESLLQEERLHIDQVAELFDVTRHTIHNYRKNGTLPEPKRDISGRPYWTIDQLEIAMKLRGIKTNYPI